MDTGWGDVVDISTKEVWCRLIHIHYPAESPNHLGFLLSERYSPPDVPYPEAYNCYDDLVLSIANADSYPEMLTRLDSPESQATYWPPLGISSWRFAVRNQRYIQPYINDVLVGRAKQRVITWPYLDRGYRFKRFLAPFGFAPSGNHTCLELTEPLLP